MHFITRIRIFKKSGSKRIQIRILVSNPDPDRGKNPDPSGSGSDTLVTRSVAGAVVFTRLQIRISDIAVPIYYVLARKLHELIQEKVI